MENPKRCHKRIHTLWTSGDSYIRQVRYVLAVFVCLQNNSKRYARSLVKFLGNVDYGTKNR